MGLEDSEEDDTAAAACWSQSEDDDEGVTALLDENAMAHDGTFCSILRETATRLTAAKTCCRRCLCKPRIQGWM